MCHTIKQSSGCFLFETRRVSMLIQTHILSPQEQIWVSFPTQENPIIGLTEYVNHAVFEVGAEVALWDAGDRLRRKTSINPVKLSVFVRRHLFYFTRLQGPISAAERVSSSPWPRSKWEAKGPVGPAARVVDWSATLTAFCDARLDVDHIRFSVQPHYRPWKSERRRR